MPLDAPHPDRAPDGGTAPPPGPGAARPLLVGADPGPLDDVLRLAEVAGVELEVAHEPGAARRAWVAAPLVLVLDGSVEECARVGLPRRGGVVLVGRDEDDAGVWRRAVDLGAEHVVVLPAAEAWLARRLADAAEPPGGTGRVVAVVGGRGGAGASVLACALATTAWRSGVRSLLVDGDPLGGGIDLLLGAEHDEGLRWPDLAAVSGRLQAEALSAALPRTAGPSVLSWDRGDRLAVPPVAMSAVLAAGRSAADVVVVDLPRHVDPSTQVVLEAADTVLLVVPAEVRACVAAGRVAAVVGQHAADLRLVVRGPAPAGLDAAAVAAALGLPLAGDVRAEPGLAAALERGDAPAVDGRGPLAGLCTALLAGLGLRAAGAARRAA